MRMKVFLMTFGAFALAANALLSTDGLSFSTRINDHDMNKIISVNLGECFTECRLRTDCLSFNFNRNYALCELLSVADANIANETGWIHKKMANENRSDLGLCKSISCPVGTVCREGQCKTERCKAPRHIDIANGEVFGNMNDVGSKILIVCNDGYVMVGQKQSVCQIDGTWSTLPTCTKVCPVPSNFQNPFDGYPTLLEASVITPTGTLNDITLIDSDTKILEGSVIIFDCAGGGYLQNKQTLYCHGTAKWIYSPNCKDLGLGIDCDVDEACSIEPHSNDCVNRVCRCPLGMSYSYSKLMCVEICTDGYATTFNEVKEVGQYGESYNLNIFHFISLEDCKLKCLGMTTYTCRSFDYSYVQGRCFLQAVTYYDDPASVYGWSGGAYFLRECF